MALSVKGVWIKMNMTLSLCSFCFIPFVFQLSGCYQVILELHLVTLFLFCVSLVLCALWHVFILKVQQSFKSKNSLNITTEVILCSHKSTKKSSIIKLKWTNVSFASIFFFPYNLDIPWISHLPKRHTDTFASWINEKPFDWHQHVCISSGCGTDRETGMSPAQINRALLS